MPGPAATDNRWLRRYQRPTSELTSDIAPTFSAYIPGYDVRAMSPQYRAAFAFLRRHGDGKYSAQSLMKLLQAADQVDNHLADGTPLDYEALPKVCVAEVPYSYDEDTEVKMGGIVGTAVVLADGRMMLAVNRATRRERVGSALYGWSDAYAHRSPVVWVHQANLDAQHFCLSMGLQPREVNMRGAVAWCAIHPRQEQDDIATEAMEDWMLDDMMASQRHARPRPRRREVALENLVRPTEAPLRPRFTEIPVAPGCGDPDCDQCRAEQYRVECEQGAVPPSVVGY